MLSKKEDSFIKNIIRNETNFSDYNVILNEQVYSCILKGYNEEKTIHYLKLDDNPSNIKEIEYSYKMIKHLIGRCLSNDPFNIETTLDIMKTRDWSYCYMYIDIHSTILYPDYGGLAKIYYKVAKNVLKTLSEISKFSIVLYTCSKKDEIGQYLDFFENDNIIFDGVNKVQVENTRGGDFTDKPYFNILLEDKAGFRGEYDWYFLEEYLKNV